MSATPVLLTATYISILLYSGYVAARYYLRMRNVLIVSGMTCIAGIALYLILINALCWIMEPRLSFVVGLVALLLWSTIVRMRTDAASCDSVPMRIRWILGGIIALCGLAYMRDPGSDPGAYTHFPLAMMIAEGNFPVMNVVHPWQELGYHYGPAMLAASFSSITGLSVATGYALQPLLNVGAIVLLSAGLAWHYTRSFPASTLCGALALGGAGLFWLNGIDLIRDLVQYYVHNQPIEPSSQTAFRNLVPTIRNMTANPVLMMLGHKPIGMGCAFTFAFLSVLHHGFIEEKQSKPHLWIPIAVVIALGLALTMETTFVILMGCLGLAALGILLHEKWSKRAWHTLGLLSAIALPTLAIAMTQGGILSVLHGDVGTSSFELFFNGHIYHTMDGQTIALWEPRFIRDFGIHAALLIAALATYWRQRKKNTFLLLLCLIPVIHFALPFFVRYTPRYHEMNRLFHIALSITSVLGGIVVWQYWVSSKLRWKKIAALSMVVAMLVASSINAPVRLLFPTLELEKTSLLPTLPERTSDQEALHAWVSDNTTLDDYFYMVPFDPTEYIQPDRARFITYTQRFLIGFSHAKQEQPIESNLTALQDSCTTEAATTLGVRYVVTENEFHHNWFTKHCSPSDWAVRYDGSSELPYPRVYERQL